MHVLDPQCALLSDYEVLALLREKSAEEWDKNQSGDGKIARHPREVGEERETNFGLAPNVAFIERKIRNYLESLPCRNYSPAIIRNFLQAMSSYRLTKAEKLMLLNLQPSQLVFLYPLVEELELRFPGETQMLELLNTIRHSTSSDVHPLQTVEDASVVVSTECRDFEAGEEVPAPSDPSSGTNSRSKDLPILNIVVPETTDAPEPDVPTKMNVVVASSPYSMSSTRRNDVPRKCAPSSDGTVSESVHVELEGKVMQGDSLNDVAGEGNATFSTTLAQNDENALKESVVRPPSSAISSSVYTSSSPLVDTKNETLSPFWNVLPNEFSQLYRVVGKIGEGTFSTVYKAVDLHYSNFDNHHWNHATNSMPFMTRSSGNPGRYTARQFVAIKKIYVTSAPHRVLSEIATLMELRGEHNVMPVITAHRCRDQVIVIMPYFEHHDFRICLHAMGLEDIRYYMKALLEALAHVHRAGIIHRDVKPSNFLYDFQLRKGFLVDFGLAQRESELQAQGKAKTSTGDAFVGASTLSWRRDSLKAGYYVGDSRPPFRAPRGGTRGFRSPEVLFRVPMQTTSLDVWSAGVILLSLLSKQFPFFHSIDDQDAIVEIACIFGQKAVAGCAARYERRWKCNLAGVPLQPVHPLDRLCLMYNPDLPLLFKPPKGRETTAAERNALRMQCIQAKQQVFDLLEQLLQLHHEDRITAEACLLHPFLHPSQRIGEEEVLR